MVPGRLPGPATVVAAFARPTHDAHSAIPLPDPPSLRLSVADSTWADAIDPSIPILLLPDSDEPICTPSSATPQTDGSAPIHSCLFPTPAPPAPDVIPASSSPSRASSDSFL